MDQFMYEVRKKLTLGDLNFITSCLSESTPQSEALLRLITDPETVDGILDQPKLLDAILDSIDHLNLSSRLYFYIITRHSLLRAGLDDSELADYLSGVLDHQLSQQTERPSVFYVIDWLQELEKQPKEKHFQLYVRAGNYLLFLTGIFPNSIYWRQRRRGAPGIGFYEDVGRYSYKGASRYAQNSMVNNKSLYGRLAEHFTEIRTALNDASLRLLHLEN